MPDLSETSRLENPKRKMLSSLKQAEAIRRGALLPEQCRNKNGRANLNQERKSKKEV
jgi:hypothetical protein